MHWLMIVISLGLASGLRCLPISFEGSWKQRWNLTLFFFLFPPLLLLTTALAVVCMGTHGEMLGLQASRFSYWFALTFLGVASFYAVIKTFQAWQACQQVKSYPQQEIAQTSARILATDFPYSAQIGFWKPELVVSKGLLATLDEDHLLAVLAHEKAHYEYRDTFWFFWLGWLRSFTAWLPNTETLWQELLLLREIRADQKAAQAVDALLLAESLLSVAQAPLHFSESYCAPFSCATPRNRLSERIDALLAAEGETFSTFSWCYSWILLIFLPWATLPLHFG